MWVQRGTQVAKTAKMTAAQMKACTFCGKEPMFVITFLIEFKFACDTYSIHRGTEMWLFKQYLTGLAEAAMNLQVTLPNSANYYHEAALKQYSAFV